MRQLGQMKKSTKTACLPTRWSLRPLWWCRPCGWALAWAMLEGQLIPICAYIVMALALNLVVGVSGELSLGHAGFMSIGAFAGSALALALQSTVTLSPCAWPWPWYSARSSPPRWAFSSASPCCASMATTWPSSPWPLARSSKSIITNVYLGVDENGLQFSFLSNKTSWPTAGWSSYAAPWA